MDFIRWMFVIYCLSIGAYLTSFSGWWAPPFSIPFMTTVENIDLSEAGNLTPVAYVFGWEVIKAVLMILSLIIIAPVYFLSFLSSFLPLWLSSIICSPLIIIFYIGLAQLLLRFRRGA